MTDTPTPAEAPAGPKSELTLLAEQYALEQLGKDPRTAEMHAALSQAIPVIAAANNVSADELRVGEMFQAIVDAWESAQVRAYHELEGLDWKDPATDRTRQGVDG